jgi:ubiquinone/menaquinone biosynthesis C-methylase UbiE
LAADKVSFAQRGESAWLVRAGKCRRQRHVTRLRYSHPADFMQRRHGLTGRQLQMPRKLMITVDVEAQPRRAASDPLERLIWGRFPGAKDAGIGRMMDIADKHGVKLTMFLDYCETGIYGDELLNVAREIHRRGHDLQLHAHLDFMPETFWSQNSLEKNFNLNLVSADLAKAAVDFICSAQIKAAGKAPVAFRGGGYRFNRHLLDALVANSVCIDSSVNVSRATQPAKLAPSPQFLWSNGCRELPVSCVAPFINIPGPFDFNFSSAALYDFGRFETYLSHFHSQHGDDAIAVLVMHSWSLLRMDREAGHFIGPDDKALDKFADFLSRVRATHDIVTMPDLAQAADDGSVSFDWRLDTSALDGEPGSTHYPERIIHQPAPKGAATRNKPMPVLSVEELCTEAERLWADESMPDNKRRAVELLTEAHSKGEIVRSAYRLGQAYLYGRGAKRDLEKAFKYFSYPELDRVRFALYFRGLVLKDPDFSGFDNGKALGMLEQARDLGVEKADEPIAEILERTKCPICGTLPVIKDGAPERTCLGCRSLERQRIFMSAYKKSLKFSYDLAGKTGLVVSPAQAEKRLFAEIGAGPLTTVDIRPDTSPDVVADICAELPMADATFDFVYASYVMTCVHDLDAALKSLRRVLKPGGFLITVDPTPLSGEIKEITDQKTITAYYGEENFNSYKVGSFRQLGLKGMQDRLAQSFGVQVIAGADPVTGQSMPIFVSVKSDKVHAAKKAAQNKALADAMAAENAENERAAGCAFSMKYLAHLAENPEDSYAKFAVSQEAASVSTLAHHATLGQNISDASRQQGNQSFLQYRSILNVKPDDRVVEYGCGSLRVGLGFVQMLRSGHFFGLDVVPEFYQLGRDMPGNEIVTEKAVQFHVIDAEGVQLAVDFNADHVYACAVIFHVHPNDMQDAMSNLARLAGKPGARLLFDAKVTRDGRPQRYAQKDGKGGWAWPLEFYQAALAPLELVGVHGRVIYDWEPKVDFAHLEFQMPASART